MNSSVRWAADELAAPAGLVEAGPDFAAAAANVAAWGGQPRIFRAALAAGVRRGPPADRATAAQRRVGGRPPTPPAGSSVAGAPELIGLLAGWRAGVLELRTEALAAAAALADRDLGEVAAAVLGLPPDRLSAFVAGQQGSALAWPGLPRTAVVQRVGGFVGLGGVWLAPPVTAVAGPDAGALVRCADDTWWVLRADVFGARLSPHPADPPAVESAAAPGVLIWPSSYLVRVTGEAW